MNIPSFLSLQVTNNLCLSLPLFKRSNLRSRVAIALSTTEPQRQSGISVIYYMN